MNHQDFSDLLLLSKKSNTIETEGNPATFNCQDFEVVAGKKYIIICDIKVKEWFTTTSATRDTPITHDELSRDVDIGNIVVTDIDYEPIKLNTKQEKILINHFKNTL